jgi:hypothetical protein
LWSFRYNSFDVNDKTKFLPLHIHYCLSYTAYPVLKGSNLI